LHPCKEQIISERQKFQEQEKAIIEGSALSKTNFEISIIKKQKTKS
jgi:hypothetical protein